MATYINYSTNNYVKSANIKVFPCAHRGYFVDGTPPTALVFDPEARSTTEANFVNTFHKLSTTKESYVVSWDESTLKCVIGGYYFEIYNHRDLEDWFIITTDEGFRTFSPRYLCIKTSEAALASSEDIDSDRKTPVLSSFMETTDYLDVLRDGNYLFTGLTIKSADELTADVIAFAPFIAEVQYITNTSAIKFNGTKFNKWVNGEDSTYGSNGEYLYIDTNGNKIPITKNLKTLADNGKVQWPADDTALYTYNSSPEVLIKVNPAAYPVTKLLDTATGEHALRQLGGPEYIEGEPTVDYYNHTTATGAYAIALGKHTTAAGNTSVALGDNTEAHGVSTFTSGDRTKAYKKGAVAMGIATSANGEGSVAIGNTAITKADGAVAFGNHTSATGTNQVVIGKYNVEDSNKAFIIGNGVDETTRDNKFTVSYTGDIKALGNIEVNGNTESSPAISSTGSGNNDLVLGTTNTGSTGSISVYGASTAKIFEVTTDGTTYIAKDTAIDGNAVIKGTIEVSNTTSATAKDTGALVVRGGAGIGGNLCVGGNATITGATTLENTLEVTDAATLNSTLNVEGATTIKANATINGNIIVDGTATLKGGVNLTDNLVVSGTASVARDTTITGKVKVNDTTQASGTTAALVVGGGEIIGNNLIINGTTDSDSTTTGALVVGGGVGIGKKLCVSGATTLNDNLTVANDKTATLGGATTIKGNTQITSDTNYSKAANGTHSAALVVNGGTYIAKKLHVEGDTTFYDNLEIGSTRVIVKKDTESTAVNNGALVVNGGVGIGKTLNVAGDVKFTKKLTLAGTSGQCNTLQLGNESTSNKGGELLIYGNGTDTVFEVDNKGNTTLEGTLTVAGVISGGNKLSIGSGTTAIEISGTGITGLSGLTVSGQINATVFNATSDARLKTNINNYKFEKSITSLPIKQFEYIKDETHTKYIGCLAQDLQEICPELVNENPDGTLSIQESKLVYALLQEVKELKEKVDQLERR